MRIPCAVKWDGVIPAGQVRDELISTVDYPVTILDAAGTAFTKNKVHGRSLLPLLTGKTDQWDDDLMAETFGHGYGEDINSRMLVHGDYKLIANKESIAELYNLRTDPFELHNLYEDPAFADVRADLENRLRVWQKRTDDPVEVL